MSELIITGRLTPSYVQDIGCDGDEWYFIKHSYEEHTCGSWFVLEKDNFVQLIDCYIDSQLSHPPIRSKTTISGFYTICKFKFDRHIDVPYSTHWWKYTTPTIRLVKLNIAEIRDMQINSILND